MPRSAQPVVEGREAKAAQVLLDADTVSMIDGIRARAGLAMLESHGVEVQPNRTDVIRSLVKTAHERSSAPQTQSDNGEGAK